MELGIDVNTADMMWEYNPDKETYWNKPTIIPIDSYIFVNDIPAWSLAALLGVLPNNKHISTTLSRGGWKIEPVEYIDKWFCEYEDEVDCKGFTVSADNPVDACYEMIIKLHELNLL